MYSMYHLRRLRVISPFMCALLLTCVLSVGSLWHTNLAHAEPATQKDVQTSEQIQQLKLDAAKESLQKDILAKNQQVESLQKTIDQQNSRIGDVGWYLTLWGILITVLLVAFALLGFVSVRSMVQKQAKTWFDENAQNLKNQISELEKEVKQFAEQGKANIQQHTDAVEATKDQAIIKIQDNLSASKETLLTPEEKSALATVVQELKQKPEQQYSFEDWNTRAFAAYQSGDYANAAYYWQQATEVPHAGIENVVTALFNKGVTLGEQNQLTEAIATYDALIDKYSHRTEASIIEQVAKAMVNKGYTLCQQDKPTEAIATYDALIDKYSHRTEAGIVEQVSKAFNGKGFAQLLAAKAVWNKRNERADLLTQANIHFEQAVARLPNNAMILGNQAYVAWLLDDTAVAQAKFSEALRAQDGGEEIYQATLGDLEVHPIDADAGFRDLIERLWQAYQAEPK